MYRHGQRGQDQVALALFRPLLVGFAALRDHQAVGGDEQVRDQRRRTGQVQHQRERVARPVRRDHDELDDDAGHPQGHDRHVVLVDLREHRRHVLRLARGEHHFGADQRPGQVGAEHRDDQPHADEDRAPRADHRLQHPRHRRLAQPGDVGALQHGVGQQRDQHHQARDDDEAHDRRLADVGALLGEARVDAGAFDADEHEHRHQHRRPDLLEQAGRQVAAVEIEAEQVHLEGDEREHDEDHDRDDLGHRDDAVDERGLLDAAQDQEVEQPDADRGERDRDRRVAVAEDREERAQRRLDQHPVRDVADAAADPVAERRQEARVVAETFARIGVDAGVDVGLALGQRLEHARQHVHAGAGDDPRDDRAQRTGRVGEGPRQREDARADHSARPPSRSAASATSSAQSTPFFFSVDGSGAVAFRRCRHRRDPAFACPVRRRAANAAYRILMFVCAGAG